MSVVIYINCMQMNKYIRTCSNECCRIMEPAKPLTRLTEEVCQEARPRQVAVGVLLSCLCSAERAVASGSDGRLFRSGGRRPLFFDPPHHAPLPGCQSDPALPSRATGGARCCAGSGNGCSRHQAGLRASTATHRARWHNSPMGRVFPLV